MTDTNCVEIGTTGRVERVTEVRSTYDSFGDFYSHIARTVSGNWITVTDSEADSLRRGIDAYNARELPSVEARP